MIFTCDSSGNREAFPKKQLLEWVPPRWLLKEKRISIFNWFLIRGTFCSLRSHTGEVWPLLCPLAPAHGRLGREEQVCGAAATVFCSSSGWTQQCPRPALHWVSSLAGGKHAVSEISKEWGISLTEGKGAEEDWGINCNPVVLLVTSFLPLCFYNKTTKPSFLLRIRSQIVGNYQI